MYGTHGVCAMHSLGTTWRRWQLGGDEHLKTSANIASPPSSFLDALVAALERAGAYNKNDQAPPDVVLWPDKERQWEPLLPRLRTRLPILTLGPYAAQEHTGGIGSAGGHAFAARHGCYGLHTWHQPQLVG